MRNFCCALVIVLLSFPVAMPAQTYTVLHAFTESPDGSVPASPVVISPAGTLLGLTASGGKSETGTAYGINPTTSQEFHIDVFGGKHGIMPRGSIAVDSHGNLYGSNWEGGAGAHGVVFKIDTAGHETVLYSFDDGADNLFSSTGVILGSDGAFYGTAAGGSGGNFGLGAVYKLDTSGVLTILYNFLGGRDGTTPTGPLLRDGAGGLYGTTSFGGGGAEGNGTVFRIDSDGNETVIHRFAGGNDGSNPNGGLVRDKVGNLYGTTMLGGANNAGIIFKIDSAGNETIFHTFGAGTDGSHPMAGLTMDRAGNFYGATQDGGSICCGTVFMFDPSGNETILQNFGGYDPNGTSPNSPITLDGKGNLYGTTEFGGVIGCDGLAGCGVVFRLTLP